MRCERKPDEPYTRGFGYEVNMIVLEMEPRGVEYLESIRV